MNSRLAIIHKKAQKQKWLQNWTIWKKKRKEKKNSAPFSTQRPPDDWPVALDHLAMGSVANKYTKFKKTNETLLFSQGLSLNENPT